MVSADMLREGEFDLDGYRFGAPDNEAIILTDGLDTGAPGIRNQDFDNPVGDGGAFGRDYLNGPTWTFTMGVLDDHDVYTVLERLASVWRAQDVRKTPGARSTLRFRRGERVYRVYGRPRRFGVNPAEIADVNWQIVTADFQVADPFMYADDESEVSLSLVNSPDPGEGLILPADLPATLRRSGVGDTGVLAVNTVEPAPFTLRVYGPATGAITDVRVAGPGFEFRLGTTIAYDETVEIDTGAQTILKDGVPIPGALLRPSRLNARLDPGAGPVTFTADDPSRSAAVSLHWRATYPIL